MDQRQWIDPHGQVDTQVIDTPMAAGDWLKLSTGQYTRKMHYAVVKHRGSYVESIQLVSKEQLPKLLQINQYYPKSKGEPRVAQWVTWWPFS